MKTRTPISIRPLRLPYRLFGQGVFAMIASCGLAAPAQVAPTVLQWETALKAREQRAGILLKSLQATDKRVESRLGNLVDALKVVTDSNDSRTKVARMQRATIDGLKKVIEAYNQRRAVIQEQIMRPASNLTDDQKRQIRRALDSRIEKRVAQIVELQKSLPTHQDYERFKVGEGGIGFVAPILKNEDWERNRRVTRQTDAVRRQLLADYQTSQARLETQERRLREQLRRQQGANPMLEEELQRVIEQIENRQVQLQEVLSDSGPEGLPVGRGEADVLSRAVELSVSGVRAELNLLFREYAECIAFLPQVNAASSQLAQAKAKAQAKAAARKPAPTP